MKNLVKIGLTVSLLAATSMGCAATNGNNDVQKSTEPQSQATATLANDDDVQENTQRQSQATVTLDQAIKTAETDQKGTATSADLDEDNGKLVYEVKLVETEVYVDANTGEILRTKANDDSEEDAQYLSLAKITVEQAKQAAETARNGTAIGFALDNEDGSLVYEIKFVDAEVYVDAGTGKVLGTKLETDSNKPPFKGSIQLPDD